MGGEGWGSGEQHGAAAQGQPSRVAAAEACTAAAQPLRTPVKPASSAKRLRGGARVPKGHEPVCVGGGRARGASPYALSSRVSRRSRSCSSAPPRSTPATTRARSASPAMSLTSAASSSAFPTPAPTTPCSATTSNPSSSRVILHPCSLAARLVALPGPFF